MANQFDRIGRPGDNRGGREARSALYGDEAKRNTTLSRKYRRWAEQLYDIDVQIRPPKKYQNRQQIEEKIREYEAGFWMAENAGHHVTDAEFAQMLSSRNKRADFGGSNQEGEDDEE
jgi:hypothetical protein